MLFTTKDTKSTKVGVIIIRNLVSFVISFENTCADDDLRIDNDSLFRHTGAGRYPSPSPPLDAGLRRHDESKE